MRACFGRIGWAVVCLSLATATRADEAAPLTAAGSASEQSVQFLEPAAAGDCPPPVAGDCPSVVPADFGCAADQDRLLGLFLQSDHAFDSFISPISNPFFFEDPRSLTEVRGLFLDNNLPSSISPSGDLQITAAQVRGRVSDRWSVIAPRLGYLNVNSGGFGSPYGFLAAPVGVKYNYLRDESEQRLASVGITYFIPGADTSMTNLGDGDFHFFASGGDKFLDAGHCMSAMGFRIPSNSNWGTQLWYWSHQWDYELPGHVYPLFGINWFHWMRSANVNLTNGVAGLDVMNLPACGVAGRNVVTGVAGLKWKPGPNLEIGGGYEFPLTDRRDILNNRAYADIIFRY